MVLQTVFKLENPFKSKNRFQPTFASKNHFQFSEPIWIKQERILVLFSRSRIYYDFNSNFPIQEPISIVRLVDPSSVLKTISGIYAAISVKQILIFDSKIIFQPLSYQQKTDLYPGTDFDSKNYFLVEELFSRSIRMNFDSKNTVPYQLWNQEIYVLQSGTLKTCIQIKNQLISQKPFSTLENSIISKIKKQFAFWKRFFKSETDFEPFLSSRSDFNPGTNFSSAQYFLNQE